MKELINKLNLMDCKEGMKRFPDKYFDLAFVDPPYGWGNKLNIGNARRRDYILFNNRVPDINYFNELFRVSKHQIIFGGNYFADKLPVSRGWIVWDKCNGDSYYADGELIWTSFDIVLSIIKNKWCGFDSLREDTGFKIHPTQKPVGIYRQILNKLLKMKLINNKSIILDTHVGSGTSLVACWEEGLEYCGFEDVESYFLDATNRLLKIKEQGKLF